MTTISMVYQTLCNWLTSRHEPIANEVQSADRFRRVLEGERMRAERSGIPFSLISFSLAAPFDKAAESENFLAHLVTRIRATDHVGWIDGNIAGVTLWNTHRDGAWKFVKQILESWSGSIAPECKVYVYPSDDQNSDSAAGKSSERTQPAAGNSLVGAGKRPNGGMPLMSHDDSLVMLFVRPLPLWKRAIDVTGALVGLVLLSPLLAVAAMLVKLTSPGPIFFCQKRVGLGGRVFNFYKFRSMYVGADAQRAALQKFSEQDGPAFKMKNDPRVTTVGRFLRRSCIDELPQLWNVLIGDMSLVGPRPLEPKETVKISGWGLRRLEVTPGLTCIWQVYGKSRVNFAEWMRMDIRYLQARTFLQDVRLIVSTLTAVVFYKVAH